jgi:hypothetical protein
MTFDEMIQFVRAQADADATDMPETILTVWARLGFNDILSRQAAWSHLQVNYVLATAPGQQSYPVATLDVSDLDRVTSIVDQNEVGRSLVPLTRSDSDVLFSGNSALLQADPMYFLIENKKIVLFPTPDSGKQYVVRGQRKPAAFPAGAGSQPDLPELLHETICYFMLAQYYLSQEDTGVYQVYLGEYERRVDQFVRYASKRETGYRHSKMGGGVRQIMFLDRVKGVLEG